MSDLRTNPASMETTKVNAEAFEELFNTTMVTCSISAAVAYFCIAGFICGMGLSGVRTHIHWNVCLALLISNVLLLVGSEKEPGSMECKAVSIATQFFNLASQTWTMVEAIHLFRLSSTAPSNMGSSAGSDNAVRRFPGETAPDIATALDNRNNHMTVTNQSNGVCGNTRDRNGMGLFCYYVIGWILPFVFMAATVVPAIDYYGASYHCWIVTDSGIIWLFIAPSVALLVFHCITTTFTITNSKNRIEIASVENHDGIQQESQIERDIQAMNDRFEQDTVFVHPPVYVISEKRLTVTLPADDATNINLFEIANWNLTGLPILAATWCLWISVLNVRLVILLYIACAGTAGQVIYMFTYYCVVTFRLERRKRVLRKSLRNEDARPVTILLSDDDENTKISGKQRKIQNIELMMRTPTPFPNKDLTLKMPQGVITCERESPTSSQSSRVWNSSIESGELSWYGQSAQDEVRHKDTSNRVKLEAFVNVGAGLIIGESGVSPPSGGYTFDYNRSTSRSPGSPESAVLRDECSSAQVDASQPITHLLSAGEEYPSPAFRQVNIKLPFAIP